MCSGAEVHVLLSPARPEQGAQPPSHPVRPCLPARFTLTSPHLPRLLSFRQWNDGEARVVMEHVRRLMAAGVPASDIGIITPYNAQVGHCGVQLYAYACCTARLRPGMLASDCAGAPPTAPEPVPGCRLLTACSNACPVVCLLRPPQGSTAAHPAAWPSAA